MEDKRVAFFQAVRLYQNSIINLYPLKATVLQRLREVAAQDGQKQTAQKIGVSLQYLNDIIHDKREPSSQFLDKVIANYSMV